MIYIQLATVQLFSNVVADGALILKRRAHARDWASKVSAMLSFILCHPRYAIV
jgi:hypothetical protein